MLAHLKTKERQKSAELVLSRLVHACTVQVVPDSVRVLPFTQLQQRRVGGIPAKKRLTLATCIASFFLILCQILGSEARNN